MSQTLLQIIKWCTIPVLVVTAMFSYFAGRYEPLVDILACLGAMIFIQRAVWRKEYLWAGGLVAIVAAFSPFPLAEKLFLVMAIICVESCVLLAGALRRRPVEIVL